MSKEINKRLSSLGVSEKELIEEKRVETHVNNMTSIEALQALKERYIDRKDELIGSSDCNPIIQFNTRIETVNQCIDLIFENKERDEMLKSIKYLLRFFRDWEREVPRGLTPMDYLTGDYNEDVKIKNKIDKMKNKWVKELKEIE